MQKTLLGLGLILSTSLSAQTYIRPIKTDAFIGTTIIQEQERYYTAQESWAPYKIDNCSIFDNSVANEYALRNKGLRRCEDGSISFVQPDSEGYQGWEGKCGQTAAANSVYHLCQTAFSPDEDLDKFLSDITPGVLPKTLRRGLTKIIAENKSYCPQGQWKVQHARNNKDFINHVAKNIKPNYSTNTINILNRDGLTRYTNPVITLIVDPGTKFLHWVTIVDMEQKENSCHFYINHWSSQYRVPCEIFATWSSRVGKVYPIILRSYTTVSFH